MTKNEIIALYNELTELENWVSPKVDPTQWPPAGWVEHPAAPGYYFRCLSEEELREEIFGSEAKTEWLQKARARIEEIKVAMIPYFFPKAKEEGTERREKAGFVTMLKTGLTRKLDVPALATIVAECQKLVTEKELSIDVEATVINWKPELKIKEFRTLPDDVRKKFENALIIEPAKPTFEIVRANDDAE